MRAAPQATSSQNEDFISTNNFTAMNAFDQNSEYEEMKGDKHIRSSYNIATP